VTGDLTAASQPAPAPEPSVLTLPGEWDADAHVLAQQGLDSTLAVAQSLRKCASEVRERLADPKTVFGLLLEERDRLAAELAEERRKAAEIREVAHNFRDVQRIDALTVERDKARAELAELDAAYKTLDARCEVHWLERQSAEAHRDRYRAALELTLRGLHGGTDVATIASTITGALKGETDSRTATAEHFAETWAELLEALPDSYDCHMNCPEANAAVEFLNAFGYKTAAREVAKAHAAHDTPEDQHYEGDDSGEAEGESDPEVQS
jgi:hypothetical protein